MIKPDKNNTSTGYTFPINKSYTVIFIFTN